MQAYTPSEVTKLLHLVPHLSLKFQFLPNPEFTFDNAAYLESLVVVAFMPVAVLLITMISFLIYYCCVEMKRSAPNKNNSTACYCSVCLMIAFIMIALGAVGAACYGSIQCNDGMESASNAVLEINQSFSSITVQVGDISDLSEDLSREASKLREDYPDNSDIKSLNGTIHLINERVSKLPVQTFGANDRLEWTIEAMRVIEWYRTVITFSLVGLQAFVCLLGLAGVCCRSKCLLISATFIGLICLVVSYLYVGLSLMTDVGIGDLCMDPYAFIKEQAVGKLYMSNDTAHYYLTCSRNVAADDRYAGVVRSLTAEVDKVQTIADEFSRGTNLTADAEKTLSSISKTQQELWRNCRALDVQLNCHQVHDGLHVFVASICGHTVEGLFILCVAFICTCVSLTVVLCAAPKSWKRYGKRKTHHESDLDLADDVFLPSTTGRAAISRTNNPIYMSNDDRASRRVSSNISSTNLPAAANSLSFLRRSEENLTLLESPPPYYPRHARQDDD